MLDFTIENYDNLDLETYFSTNSETINDIFNDIFIEVGVKSGDDVVLETRSEELKSALQAWLEAESVILSEVTTINDSTIKGILDIINKGVEEDRSTNDIQQNIIDAYAFSPARALTISRTISANAQNIGQMVSALEVGAEYKTWRTSGFNVRDIHKKRNRERVEINKRFSLQAGVIAPRHPSDHECVAEDRINCRCAMSFSYN